MRYFIQFSYFGKAYHGWQNQPNAITVQEVLEKALSTLLREKIEVVGAGRTDAGVHARQMFAHFDFEPIPDIEYWLVKEKDPFLFDHAHFVKHPLDVDAMNQAAKILLQYTDFECFSKSNTDVKTYNCDIRKAHWKIDEDKWVFNIAADRFLRNKIGERRVSLSPQKDYI